MADESDRERLPFEPSRKRKKPEKKAAPAPSQSATADQRSPTAATQRADARIPEVVSRRMLRRMLTFSGIPTGLGIATFFVSYFLLTREIVDLPNTAVLLTTLGCFGLGVVGLSYGALSASWDETSPGGLLGIEEFKMNFQRLIGSWRQAREERQQRSQQ